MTRKIVQPEIRGKDGVDYDLIANIGTNSDEVGNIHDNILSVLWRTSDISKINPYNATGTTQGIDYVPLNLGTSIVCGGKGVFRTLDGYSWENVYTSTSKYYSPVFGNDILVSIPSTGTAFIYSSDSIAWNEANTSELQGNFNNVVFANNIFVCSGTSNNGFAYSKDGVNWFKVNGVQIGSWSEIRFSKNLFIASNQNTIQLAYSRDGINWSIANFPETSITGGSLELPIYGNGVFVTSTSKLGASYYSTDGINWAQSTLNTVIPNLYFPNSIAFASNTFVLSALYNNQETKVYWSANGIEWQLSNTPSTVQGTVLGANNLFILSGDTSSISYDGKIFVDVEQTNLKFDSSFTSIDNLYYTNKIYIAQSLDKIFISFDGVNWGSISCENQINCPIWNKGVFVGTYGSGAYVVSAPNSNLITFNQIYKWDGD